MTAMMGQIPRRERGKVGNYRDNHYFKQEERQMRKEAQMMYKEKEMEE